jgi:hypothetical protein
MLKYNIRKRKHWVPTFFRDNLNWGAYIISKELNQDPRNSFQSQIYFILPRIIRVAFAIYVRSCSINCTKSILAASSTFRTILRNKWIIDARYRTADTREPRGNTVVRRLACSVAWKFSFWVFPQVALPCPQLALLHSVTCVQLGLITVVGNRGCVAVSSFLGVPSALQCCFFVRFQCLHVCTYYRNDDVTGKLRRWGHTTYHTPSERRSEGQCPLTSLIRNRVVSRQNWEAV